MVRGSLVVCGRPDGRLSGLSSLESAVCLSINQASSIQSLGSTCESVTIGHNPFKLPLTENAIILDGNRPLFLCERMLGEAEEDLNITEGGGGRIMGTCGDKSNRFGPFEQVGFEGVKSMLWMRCQTGSDTEINIPSHDREQGLEERRPNMVGNGHPRPERKRSSMALLGAYLNLENETKPHSSENVLDASGRFSTQELIQKAIHEHKWSDHVRRLFEVLDKDKDGILGVDEFVSGYSQLKPTLSPEQLLFIFRKADKDGSSNISLDEFFDILRYPEMEMAAMSQPSIRDSRGLIQIEPNSEEYFGESIFKARYAGKSISTGAIQSQHLSQELYEARVASLQRFVAMTIMFHQMGHRVQSFFATISLGLLRYRMDRTHSIMRIATTASPVSGADVRERMRTLQCLKKIYHSIRVISTAWLRYKKKKEERQLQELKEVCHSTQLMQAKEKEEKRRSLLVDKVYSCPENLHLFQNK